MKTISKFIKSKIWISAIISIFFILFIIPSFFILFEDEKIIIPDGKYIKKGNRIFYNTLEQLKKQNGYLILGTSETGNGLNGQNYYHLLNKDKTINKPFLTLGGAGRCINTYFPFILDKSDVFTDLKVIYYINPTYWRSGLNAYSQTYFERYVDCDILINSIKTSDNYQFINEYISKPKIEKSNLETSLLRVVDNFKSFYYYDLKNQFISINYLPTNKSNTIENYYSEKELSILKNEINFEYNTTNSFLKSKSAFPSIDKNSNYQTQQLNTFIRLCKLYNIKPTFYIGPYNKVYCEKMNPERISDYEKTINDIKENLTKKKMKFIDGSEISNIPGTFLDVQHISKYGAYLTAKQFKNFIIQSKDEN